MWPLLPLLGRSGIEQSLEVGRGKISVEALKMCPSCKKAENHERLPGESKKTRMPRAVGLILAQWSAEQDFDGVPTGVNPIRNWTASDFVTTRGGGGTGVRGPGIGARAGRVPPDDGGDDEGEEEEDPPHQKSQTWETLSGDRLHLRPPLLPLQLMTTKSRTRMQPSTTRTTRLMHHRGGAWQTSARRKNFSRNLYRLILTVPSRATRLN